MNKNRFPINLFWIAIITSQLCAQTPGYFKDLFCDGGAYLTSVGYLWSAEDLNLAVEYLNTDDISVQNGVMIADGMDSNGHLLYPDGAPRFRMIYTNGGNSTNHGNSLGIIGRERVRTFYTNGGSYSGSCAGAFLSSVHWEETGINYNYYQIWPGRTTRTHLSDASTGHFIPEGSPLLHYFDFGGDAYIADVTHNGGCYANEQTDYPPETEVLLRYDYPGLDMHEKASTWAYKLSGPVGRAAGRIVVTGSHPELIFNGERFEMMQAILLYALDGTGDPQIKGELINGEMRSMDLYAEDNIPEFTRIGDKQYHHFTISVPETANSLTIELSAEAGFDFNLYASPGGFAFDTSAQFTSLAEGAEHVLEIPVDEVAEWYIGVECASTVEAENFTYSGSTAVLNGVAYGLTATWDTEVVGIAGWSDSPSGYNLYPNYPNPFNPITTIRYEVPEQSQVTLTVFDVLGQEVMILQDGVKTSGIYEVQWNGLDQSGKQVNSGVYFCHLMAVDYSKTRRMVYLR